MGVTDNNQPLVSIIMGIYNCEKTLSRAIDSVINQTYSNWELIMCDDASTDLTYSIAESYSNNYPDKIRVLRNKENRKLAYSLNQCLSISSGLFVARMDADDYNLPNRIEKEVEFLVLHPEYDLVSCRAIVFDENGDRGIRDEAGEHYKEEMIKGLPFLHPTIMVRKESFDELGGYTVDKRTERGQDVDLYYRFFAAGMRGYTIDEALYKYHESISDYKKRSIKVALNLCKTRLYGHRLLRFPLKYRIYVIRPLVSAITPRRLKYYRRNIIENKKNNKKSN